MTAKHTPGPWKATASDPAEGAHVFWITAHKAAAPHNGEVDVCTVGGDKPANARLIAAAPELLEALKEVVRLSDRKHDAWNAARAAIAKAEGRETKEG